MLIILSGSSGSGKNTIIKEIIKRKPHVKVWKSCTTRKKRSEEDDAYIFLTPEEFKKMQDNDEFFEVEEVHKGNLYGTLKKALENVKDDAIYIKDIEVNGAMKLKDKLKEHVKLIYLDVPKEVLRERIIKRGETPQSAELRLSRFDYERSFIDKYDLVIKNNELEKSVKKIIKALKI